MALADLYENLGDDGVDQEKVRNILSNPKAYLSEKGRLWRNLARAVVQAEGGSSVQSDQTTASTTVQDLRARIHDLPASERDKLLAQLLKSRGTESGHVAMESGEDLPARVAVSVASRAVHGVPQQGLPVDPEGDPDEDGYWDRKGLAVWNDRNNRWETHLARKDIVKAIVFEMILCDKFYYVLLKADLIDKEKSLVLIRDPQSGKTQAQVVIAYISALCYGHAAFLSLRSGNGAKQDYSKFDSDAVKSWNDKVTEFLVKKFPEEFKLNNIACKPKLEPYLLTHCNLWHDKECKSDSAKRAIENKYPFVFSRLGTASNLNNSIRKEVPTLLRGYGFCPDDGTAKLTYIRDEIQQRHGSESEIRPSAIQQAEAEEHMLLHDIRMESLKREFENVLKTFKTGNSRRAEALRIAFDNKKIDGQGLAHAFLEGQPHTITTAFRSHVMVTATGVSTIINPEYGRDNCIIEMEVTDDHFSINQGVPGQNPAKVIPVTYAWGSDIHQLPADEHDLPSPCPTGLQKFAIKELQKEYARGGFSHTILHINIGNNGIISQVARWLPCALPILEPNAWKSGQAVVAVTAYSYTDCAPISGGPFMTFSREGFPIVDKMAAAAEKTFTDANRKQGIFTSQLVEDNGKKRYAWDKYGSLIAANEFVKEFTVQHEYDCPPNKIVQFPRSCPLQCMLSVLHQAVEDASFSKECLNIITVGNGQLQVGCTPKTLCHQMGATLTLFCGSEKSLRNMDHMSAEQAVCRINGTRGCAYWKASGVEVPRAVINGFLKVNLEAGHAIQRRCYDLFANNEGQESINSVGSSNSYESAESLPHRGYDEDDGNFGDEYNNKRQPSTPQGESVLKKLRTNDFPGCGDRQSPMPKPVKKGQAQKIGGMKTFIGAIKENSSPGGSNVPHCSAEQNNDPLEFAKSVWIGTSSGRGSPRYHQFLRELIRRSPEDLRAGLFPYTDLENLLRDHDLTNSGNLFVGKDNAHGYYHLPVLRRVNELGQDDSRGKYFSLASFFQDAVEKCNLTKETLHNDMR